MFKPPTRLLYHISSSRWFGIVRKPRRRSASFFCSQTTSFFSFSSSRRVTGRWASRPSLPPNWHRVSDTPCQNEAKSAAQRRGSPWGTSACRAGRTTRASGRPCQAFCFSTNRLAASAARWAILSRSYPHSSAMRCLAARTSSINALLDMSCLHLRIVKECLGCHHRRADIPLCRDD